MGIFYSYPSASSSPTVSEPAEKFESKPTIKVDPSIAPVLASTHEIPLRHRPTTLSSSFDVSPVELQKADAS
jgi:hypothetical protein